jgi:nicotinate-nucleotide pyrophosphorylase (carboxylating)
MMGGQDMGWSQIERIVDAALAEDLGQGDITTDTLVPADQVIGSFIVSRGEGVLAGIGVALAVFERVDRAVEFRELLSDGSKIGAGARLAEVRGRAAAILGAERVALNFVQRLSGIATLTARYVQAVAGTKAIITDTRKTTPGLRALEKYAVRVGGAHNHRIGLSDGVLIKDNHLACLRPRGLSLGRAIKLARAKAPHTLRIEVEVESVEQALEALASGADIIMLDNMKLDQMKRVIQLMEGRVLIEASGGVTLDNVRAIAETGVNYISIGAITHSAAALDIGLEFDR